MVDNSINIHKKNKHLLIEHTKTMAYDVGNPVPGLGQAQKCGRVKPVNGIPTLLKIGSPTPRVPIQL